MKKILLASVATLATVSALAADLPARKAPVIAPPPPMWTGFYAGLNAGYNFGANGHVGVANFAPAWTEAGDGLAELPGSGVWSMDGVASNTQSGFIGGGQVGYNYQYGTNFLFGIEADIQGAGVRGASQTAGAIVTPPAIDEEMSTATGASGVQGGLDWLGTVRGRVGYLLTPTLLLYGTGGFAYGGAYANIAQTAVEHIFDSDDVAESEGNSVWRGVGRQNQLLTGWTAGGGTEWMFMPNWSLKAEALYWDLGRMRTQTTAFGVSGSA